MRTRTTEYFIAIDMDFDRWRSAEIRILPDVKPSASAWTPSDGFTLSVELIRGRIHNILLASSLIAGVTLGLVWGIMKVVEHSREGFRGLTLYDIIGLPALYLCLGVFGGYIVASPLWFVSRRAHLRFDTLTAIKTAIENAMQSLGIELL
ncbi:MAG: hypothetical protein QW304_08885 [Thermoproteota archaeon]